jgi:ketopantoate reductase
MLLRGGADITFLVRPHRVARLAEQGLTIRLPEGAFKTPIKLVIAGALDGPYDVAFLTCKAYDLDSAIDNFTPALSPSGVEGEHVIGDLARRADRLGVDAPIVRAALCSMQIYEARRRRAERTF